MNTTILQKCVVELKKESPNLQYVLGIMETLIDMSSNSALVTPGYIPNGFPTPPYTINSSNTTKSDEKEEVPAHLRPGPIGSIS